MPPISPGLKTFKLTRNPGYSKSLLSGPCPRRFSILYRNVGTSVTLTCLPLDFKLPQYVSWRPDPGAQFINALLMNWKAHYFYAFPPFSLLATCLQKIEQDQSTGILMVPMWTTQPWFTLILNLLTDNLLVLPQTDSLLFLPHSNAVHPLSRQLQLMACKVSGSPSSRELFQAKLPTSSCSLGQLVPKNNMPHISRNGVTFALNGKLIHTIHL